MGTDVYIRPFFSSFALQRADERIFMLTKKIAPLWKALLSLYNMELSTFREACNALDLEASKVGGSFCNFPRPLFLPKINKNRSRRSLTRSILVG